MSLHGRATVRPAKGREGPPSRHRYSTKTEKDEEHPLGRRFRYGSKPLLGSLAALAYGLTSLAMVFLNKGVLMEYKYSLTLFTLQMLASAGLIQVARLLGLVKVAPLSLARTRRLLPLAAFSNANVAFALASLHGINIPMYIALKRLTPMGVLVAGQLTGKARPPLQVTLSVLLTTLGCMVAALGDFSFDLGSYALAILSVFFQTMYLVAVERSGAEDGISSTEMLLYNSLMSVPVLSLILLLTGEGQVSLPLLITQCAGSLGLSVLVALSLVLGILLNLSMLLCTLTNSALSTTIVGVLKGVASTGLGFFVLGGVEVRALNMIGILLNSVGGLWYSYAKYRQKGKKTKSAPEAEPLLPTSVPPRPVV